MEKKKADLASTYYDMIIQRHQQLMTGVSCKQLQALVEEVLSVKIQADECAVVSDEDLQILAEAKFPCPKLDDDGRHVAQQEGYVIGYNAAIQSQQKTESYTVSMIPEEEAIKLGRRYCNKNAIDGKMKEQFRTWIDGYNTAAQICNSQPSQSVQPTGSVIEWSDNLNKAINAVDVVDIYSNIISKHKGQVSEADYTSLNNAIEECKVALDKMRKQVYTSHDVPTATDNVREIAKREFDKEPALNTHGAIVWSVWKRAYDSAARNLPHTGYTEEQMQSAKVAAMKAGAEDALKNLPQSVGSNGWADDDMKRIYWLGVTEARKGGYGEMRENAALENYKLTYSPAQVFEQNNVLKEANDVSKRYAKKLEDRIEEMRQWLGDSILSMNTVDLSVYDINVKFLDLFPAE